MTSAVTVGGGDASAHSRVVRRGRGHRAHPPLAFFEIVMNIAFRSLVDGYAEVSVETGLRAAEKLQSLLDKRDQGDEVADMRRHVNMITDAVKPTVPEEYWGQIAARLDLEQHPEALDVGTDDIDDDDPFDPTEFIDDDDEF